MKSNLLLSVLMTISVVNFAVSQQALVAPEGFDQPTSAEKGEVKQITYPSTTVGVDRLANIYFPPGYQASKQYPVLYLLHGIGGDEREWLDQGVPNVILDNLYASEQIRPMIVVMPNGRAMVNDRAEGEIFSRDKVGAFARFEQDLLEDLIPYIEKTLNIKSGRENRALAGLSMGGGQALNFGFYNSGHFGWIGAFSPAPNTKKEELLVPNPDEAKSNLKLLFLSCGDQDYLLNVTKATHDYLVQQNIGHVYRILPEYRHDFKYWKNELYFFSQLIFVEE